MNYQVSQSLQVHPASRSEEIGNGDFFFEEKAVGQWAAKPGCLRRFPINFAFVVPIIATMFKNPLPSASADSKLSERSGSWSGIPLSNDTFRYILGWVILVHSFGVIQGLDLETVGRFVGGFLISLGEMAQAAIQTTTLSRSTIEREVVGTTLTALVLLGVSDWITQVFQSKASPTLFLAKKTGT